MPNPLSESNNITIIQKTCDLATVCSDLNIVPEWRNEQRSIFQMDTELATKWRWVLIALCALLLSVGAVATGLFLSICGTNLIGLLVSSTTGSKKQRCQAPAIRRISRHRNWLTCSLVIIVATCNVLVTEILRILLGKEAPIWETIVASALIIALVGQLLPQRIAMTSLLWNCYCYPLIWCAMLVTAPVSWVLGKFFDRYQVLDNNGVYTNQQINALIKYHGRLERRGGDIGPDAVRIIRSALDLDRLRLNGRQLASANQDSTLDVESGELTERLDMIAAWSQIKTVDINDEVDRLFMKKIKSWPYTRIPVVAKGNADQDFTSREELPKGYLTIYGFLHIKDLLNLQSEDLHGKPILRQVKDLPLYPLPVVREDMLVYEILNMFQLGISRIALVVPINPDHDDTAPSPIEKHASVPSYLSPPSVKREHSRYGDTTQRTPRFAGEQNTWTMCFLQAAQGSLNELSSGRRQTFPMRIPCPVGIVTHADIINALLRSSGIDEKGFFGSQFVKPLKKQNVQSDKSTSLGTPNMSSLQIRQSRLLYAHSSLERIHGSNVNGTLRRRRDVSGQVDITNRTYGGFDGANDRGSGAVNDTDFRNRLQLKQNLAYYTEYSTSSYTQNSGGGFHVRANNSESLPDVRSTIANLDLESSRMLEEPQSGNILARTVSMPTATLTSTLNTVPLRRVTDGFPRLPNVRRVTPISDQPFQKFEIEEKNSDSIDKFRAQTLSNKENYQDSFSPASPCSGIGRQMCISDDASSWKSPSRTLRSKGHTDAHNWYPEIPAYSSSSMPRLLDSINNDNADAALAETTPEVLYKDDSFHDDRCFLPSQRRSLSGNEGSGGLRRISSWW